MTHLLAPRPKKLPGAGVPFRSRALRELPPHLAPPRPRRTRRRVLAKVLLAGCSLLFALALAVGGYELYLRSAGEARFPALGNLYDFYENDDVPGHVRLIPGYRGSQVVEGREVGVAVNSLGMRGPEIPPPAPGQLRVLFLGDSIPFGHGVEAEESFPMQVEALLADAVGRDVVVGNAGVPGASHADQVRQLERYAAAFRPDLVVSCLYTGNDFDGDFFGPKTAIDGYWFGTAAARLIESTWRARLCLHLRTAFVFEQLLAEHVPALAMDRSAMEPTAEERARYAAFDRPVAEGLFMDAVDPDRAVVEVLESLRHNLERIEARAGEVPVLVAVLPSWAETWPGVHAVALQELGVGSPEDFRRGLGARRVASLCHELELPCVDLTPAMAGHAAPASLYLPTDLHYSAAGNRFVAEILTDRIAATLQPQVAAAGGR